MTANKVAYLSFDIETDGPSPLTNSMLSLGIVLIDDDGVVLDELLVNIIKRKDMEEDVCTMDWWKTVPDAWSACHIDMVSPHDAMRQVATFYEKWMNNYKLIWCAMPACFDWMFLKSYYMAYKPTKSPDIGYHATCISTLRDYSIKNKIITNKQYTTITTSIPSGTEHCALDDARHQGLIFINLNKFIKNLHTKQ